MCKLLITEIQGNAPSACADLQNSPAVGMTGHGREAHWIDEILTQCAVLIRRMGEDDPLLKAPNQRKDTNLPSRSGSIRGGHFHGHLCLSFCYVKVSSSIIQF